MTTPTAINSESEPSKLSTEPSEEQPLASESNAPFKIPDEHKRTLVIGDIHGHLDRFEALMLEAGLIGMCEACSADAFEPSDTICSACDGDGWVRTQRDTTRVVLVGDVAHFGTDGSPTGDFLCYRYADKWADVILWGNHDYAAFGGPVFKNYLGPVPETRKLIYKLYGEDRLKLAIEVHGWLATHAGLHAAFKHQNVPPEVKEDPKVFVDWIEQANLINFELDFEPSKEARAVRDAVSGKRNGRAQAGGILWRDVNEKLYRPFRQVFGHSAQHATREVRNLGNHNWCIDIGGKPGMAGAECLAGIWLPDEEIVTVRL